MLSVGLHGPGRHIKGMTIQHALLGTLQRQTQLFQPGADGIMFAIQAALPG